MDEYTRPDRDRAVLLTIDVQNDFVVSDAPAKIEGTQEVIPKIQKLLKISREENIPIIHVVRLYREDGSNVDISRKQTIENGKQIVSPKTNGSELVRELKPKKNIKLKPTQLLDGKFQKIEDKEWIMYKPRWSAFHSTSLDKS